LIEAVIGIFDHLAVGPTVRNAHTTTEYSPLSEPHELVK
jgi:hypothetical protein